MTAKASSLLYRRILKGASKFPSKNRWKIYEEIRAEFRRNKDLDPESAKAQECVEVAVNSLKQLAPYTEFDPDAKEWVFNTVEQPMPPPKGWKKDITELNPSKPGPRQRAEDYGREY
mmetsp:Transcript_23620/g.75806  ORF Transcript_23620/g.75806 Transcript_23620/m.75806 type:complete len:117 (+) Transcript_23620:1218-1568(+)|eukprot:CAMPEP_0118911046 /NCGR_PEP_ID=MMETSP1166-20130328/12917_1 /TAXON_ID=1104430 /ORGANISM="Chrysoreinhardia sp, Strain CCMP3193" /LENGTH=116 /DNA_ID=CAMNT_0006850521 /DNA_START=32 /DNA_END=382 /DNA_ORIENTATION=+